MTKSVLILSTSREKLPVGNGDKKIGGLWLEELAAPYFILEEAGFDVTVASVKGGKIPVDPNSLAEGFKTSDCEKFLGSEKTKKLIEESIALQDVNKTFDAVFLPGGHGACYDLNTDPIVIALLEKQWAAGGVIAAVCHGPAGLIKPQQHSGDPIVKGKKVTGFSNSEEAAVGLTDEVPFLLEDALKEQGGLYSSGPDWGSYAVADGNLITGQNPGSSAEVAKLIVKALST